MNRKTVALICVVLAAYLAGASSTACDDWIPYIDDYLWIGGREFYGRWQWEGNIRKDIVVADWHKYQPDNYGDSQDCLGLFHRLHKLQWDDGTCSSANNVYLFSHSINIIFIKLCDIFKSLLSDGLQGFLAESVHVEIISSLYGLL
ncbi:hypothetical protein EB796_013692 [Bugula neritina]|uniref:C-type lectin domain-containing protein n=1 Tax=Bugula neritina TaxID=10212 RepID=A0A7J7JRD0_BUGNE|nr:hypothetical protein EB796_013692 [Bugula neritina]